MRSGRRALIITLMLALLAGVLGAFVGTKLSKPIASNGNGLHALLHDHLDLTARQDKSIAAEEESFRTRRAAVERRVRSANAELAQAIRTTKRDGPEVQIAIDRVHKAMGEYQKETIAHVFRMRAVLTPEQSEVFDKAVADALTKDDH
jgi:nickel and cobalt resistance protein CnrR